MRQISIALNHPRRRGRGCPATTRERNSASNLRNRRHLSDISSDEPAHGGIVSSGSIIKCASVLTGTRTSEAAYAGKLRLGICAPGDGRAPSVRGRPSRVECTTRRCANEHVDDACDGAPGVVGRTSIGVWQLRAELVRTRRNEVGRGALEVAAVFLETSIETRADARGTLGHTRA